MKDPKYEIAELAFVTIWSLYDKSPIKEEDGMGFDAFFASKSS